MRRFQYGGRRLAGAVGAVAAGLGAGQSSDAAVVYTPVDVDIPGDTTAYQVDLNGDGIHEFEIRLFDTVTKVADIADATALVEDPDDNRTANLPMGALIGPASMWGPDGAAPSGGDPLNGTINFEPAGHFQVTDGPGFIGVRFQISGNTHYGYVGYEGTGFENDASGHIFALGYDNTPDTPIAAGAGIPVGLPGDYNDNGIVDAADYTVWRDNLGGLDSALANRDPNNTGEISGADYDSWKANFGATAGSGVAIVGGSHVPEATSLGLLAAGAAGLGLYRRRSRSDLA